MDTENRSRRSRLWNLFASRVDLRGLLLALGFVAFLLPLESLLFASYRDLALRRVFGAESETLSPILALTILAPYAVSGLVLIVYVYASLVSSRIISVFYFLFFSLACFYEFSYQHLFDRFSIVPDLAVAFITTSDQRNHAIASYVSMTAMIPCAVYLTILFMGGRARRLSVATSGIGAIAVIAMLVAFNFTMWVGAPKYYFHEAWNSSFGAATRTLLGYSFTRTFPGKDRRETLAPLNRPARPDNNIVLVIDESVRADHLSLNGYERKTTPYLSHLAGRSILTNWGIAAAASTRSEESYQHIITGISPGEPGEILEMRATYPSLFQYAKIAGYTTIYLDGQQNEYWGGSTSDAKYIDVFAGVKYFDEAESEPWNIDVRIATKAREIVESSRGNFIVIFKRGAHTPYLSNFPPDEATWQPSMRSFAEALKTDTEKVRNTYDNALKYNLDGFFRALMSDDEKLPARTVVIYTSDHGQTLSEQDEPYTHGGESVREATVPLFTIGDLGTRPDTGFKATHANIFAGVLDLMEVPDDIRTRRYAISFLKAKATDSSERFFITPHVMPGDNYIQTNAVRKFD